jgi:DNA-binding NarL/FixJ family response regulator
MLCGVLLRCVIVDDSPSLLSASKALLERQGVDVVGLASSESEAVEVIGRTHPEVALVDIDLASESGFDVVRRIAGDPTLAATACILISTHDESDFAELIDASPALGFIAKAALSGDAIRALLSDARGR